jgi:hypothetical protein
MPPVPEEGAAGSAGRAGMNGDRVRFVPIPPGDQPPGGMWTPPDSKHEPELYVVYQAMTTGTTPVPVTLTQNLPKENQPATPGQPPPPRRALPRPRNDPPRQSHVGPRQFRVGKREEEGSFNWVAPSPRRWPDGASPAWWGSGPFQSSPRTASHPMRGFRSGSASAAGSPGRIRCRIWAASMGLRRAATP